MGVLDRLFKKESKPTPKAQFTGYGNSGWRNLGQWAFNGEKNLGEMGPIKNYWVDYDTLRIRSWQMYLESELAQIVIGKKTKWVIGSGLKLQLEPNIKVLKMEGISVKREEISSDIEARFSLYANSRRSSYSGMTDLMRLQNEAYKNAKVGGDVLVILRYIDNCVKVQLIDGAHVMNPLRVGTMANLWYSEATENGNRIENGIELGPNNEHIAYYVRKPGLGLFDTDRVPAYGKRSKLRQAYLIYGSQYRIDNMRGLPLVSVIMETIKKLERYKEATVATAEELAKIAFQIVHKPESTGESPLQDIITKAYDAENRADLPKDIDGKELADQVIATTNKQTFNNPIGAEIKTINPNRYQLYFKDFYEVNSGLICSTVDIPPDVAFSKYNSNYSASRAAIKDWEHSILVEREDFGKQFLTPILQMWMYVEVLNGKIQAPGYLSAIIDDNYSVIEAYQSCRWAGASVPHIDPLKEVNAERLKLGKTGENIPLTTVEQATEALNSGDSEANMEQYSEEYKRSKKLGIKPEEPKVKPSGQSAGASLNGQVASQQLA